MNFHLLQPIEQLIFKLTYCKGIGISGKWKVVSFAEQYQKTIFSPEEIIRIASITQYQSVFKKSWAELTNEWLEQQANKQQFITWLSPEYPEDLQHFYQAPLILFYIGNLDLLKHQKLAFVGARDASKYGIQVLYQVIPRIVQRNIVTISGLAKGIDQYSHELTIRAGGHTIGVIGCGLDLCYPKEVAPIFLEMRRNHLILSEYPNGTKIQRHHFPMRNRIIAGLSQGTCVIEAKERSGSLITAQLALEYGKEVFAIPGEILSGKSNGCHRLIQDGAKCVYTIQDILEELP